MDILKKHIKISKTARYASYGQLSSKTQYFWFVLHGSKMLSEQLIYKFKDFDPTTHFVIAPEGLNRFYEKGFGGNVVASWMTKRDRLEEINDFSNYLSLLYNNYLAQLPLDCIKTVMGFSQGGTTAFRWLHNTKIDIDKLIAYSCWIPEDIDLIKSKTDLAKRNIIYSYGIQDQYLSDDKIGELKSVITKNKLTIKTEPYPGDHRVDRKQLLYLFNKYIK